ncbi:hypothetical protein [Symbioplanes lichenis]|uniref:hypothetical protein n=1 Tax=Symbioplanes lichenis TaxID=1629072 RepID=UPI0027385AFE|nr:hypothetical protein [Actinoplanes lichenis]
MGVIPEWADPAVPVSASDPQGVNRRTLLRRAGLFGAGFAAAGPGETPAVIRGTVRGPARDRDSWRAPDTRVVKTFEAPSRTLRWWFSVTEPSCLRLRGSDGKRHGAGLFGAKIDPHGPIAHTPGDGDPWLDTWLSTNPMFVDVR